MVESLDIYIQENYMLMSITQQKENQNMISSYEGELYSHKKGRKDWLPHGLLSVIHAEEAPCGGIPLQEEEGRGRGGGAGCTAS